MEDLFLPIWRTGVSFIILVLVTFSIGKHINPHKNHYSFALSITIGSFIANMGFDTKIKFKEMLSSFLVLVLLSYFLMLLSSRSRGLRKWLSGRPTVIIEKGKLLDNNMKKIKFSIDDLNQLMREKDIFNISEVEYALLEVSGELSVLKKKPFQNLIKQDLNFPNSPESLPIELIMDGDIIHKNAVEPYNQKWIESECKKRNVQIVDVYYAVVNSSGSLFLDMYKDKIPSKSSLILGRQSHCFHKTRSPFSYNKHLDNHTIYRQFLSE